MKGSHINIVCNKHREVGAAPPMNHLLTKQLILPRLRSLFLYWHLFASDVIFFIKICEVRASSFSICLPDCGPRVLWVTSFGAAPIDKMATREDTWHHTALELMEIPGVNHTTPRGQPECCCLRRQGAMGIWVYWTEELAHWHREEGGHE